MDQPCHRLNLGPGVKPCTTPSGSMLACAFGFRRLYPRLLMVLPLWATYRYALLLSLGELLVGLCDEAPDRK